MRRNHGASPKPAFSLWPPDPRVSSGTGPPVSRAAHVGGKLFSGPPELQGRPWPPVETRPASLRWPVSLLEIRCDRREGLAVTLAALVEHGLGLEAGLAPVQLPSSSPRRASVADNFEVLGNRQGDFDGWNHGRNDRRHHRRNHGRRSRRRHHGRDHRGHNGWNRGRGRSGCGDHGRNYGFSRHLSFPPENSMLSGLVAGTRPCASGAISRAFSRPLAGPTCSWFPSR